MRLASRIKQLAAGEMQLRNVLRVIAWRLGDKSFSQMGEDRKLHALLGHRKHGFYIDVGAYRPIIHSNSYYFYIRGWRGVTVEPQTRHADWHRSTRPRDTQLSVGVGREHGTMTFYEMDPGSLSTFCRDEAERVAQMPGHEIVSTHDVEIMPLSAIFEQHAPAEGVDFLSVDAEGFEEEVLGSNDWERHRPTVVVVESAAYEAEPTVRPAERERLRVLREYFAKIDYQMAWDNGLNSIFRDAVGGNRGC